MGQRSKTLSKEMNDKMVEVKNVGTLNKGRAVGWED